MPLIQHFIVEGKYLGQASRERMFVHGELQEPQSFAWFCPGCGDVWARAPVEGGVLENWWRVVGGPCRKHYTHASAIPGSLWCSWEPEFNEALPDEVLSWEVDRHLDHAERLLT